MTEKKKTDSDSSHDR